MMDRLEKAEKALSELMAVVREMRQEKCNIITAGEAYGCMMTDHNINGFVPGDWAICDAPHEKDLLWGAPMGNHVGKPIRLHTIYRSIASTEDGLVWRTSWLRKVPAPVQSTEPQTVAMRTVGCGDGYNIAIVPTDSPRAIPFSVALEYMRVGREVRRQGWGYGYLSIRKKNGAGYSYISRATPNEFGDGLACMWQPTEAQILATDWEVLGANDEPIEILQSITGRYTVHD